jgi:hypothetical protein
VIDGRPGKPATPDWHPPTAWIEHLKAQARENDCKIYEKTNLWGARILELPRELPVSQDVQEAPEVFRYLKRGSRTTAPDGAAHVA